MVDPTRAAAIAAIISAVAAIASAIIGSTIMYRIASRQIRAGTSSAGRQRWMEPYRENISSLIGHLFTLDAQRAQGTIMVDRAVIYEIVKSSMCLVLLLDMSNKNHADLGYKISALLENIFGAPNKTLLDEDMQKQAAEMAALAKSIIASEWALIRCGK